MILLKELMRTNVKPKISIAINKICTNINIYMKNSIRIKNVKCLLQNNIESFTL
jgi:hypothetical protein